MKQRVLGLLLLVCAPASMEAAPLVSNLAGTDSGNLSPQSTFWIGQKFDTGNTSERVSAAIFRGARHASQTVSFELYAHDDGTNAPVTGGTPLATFDASGVTDTTGSQTCAAIGDIVLAANTSYWLVLKPSNVNTALWGTTSTLGTLSGSGTIANRRATSNNSGTSWSGTSDGVSNLKIEIESTPEVPRPTLTVKGKRRIKTSRPVAKIRGSAFSDVGISRVEYKADTRRFLSAKGTTNWTVRLKLRKRRTPVLIRAVDNNQDASAVARVVVIRKVG